MSQSSNMPKKMIIWMILLSICQHKATGLQRGKVMAFFQQSCETASVNPCQQLCENIQSGGFYCKCQTGYSINKDGMTCSQIPNSPASIKTVQSHSQVDVLENESELPVPKVNKLKPENLMSKDRFSSKLNGHSDSEVVISDKDIVHVKTIDLGKDFDPPSSSDHRNLVLHPNYYNVIKDGQETEKDKKANTFVRFNPLDIPEGGDDDDSDLELKQIAATSINKELSEVNRAVSCEHIVCKNNGTCTLLHNQATCLCPLGTYGTFCDKEVKVRYPKFVGTGFIALPTLRNAHKEFHVLLEFMPQSLTGLLLFSAEHFDAPADFFSLVMDDGYLVFRFDCGTGVAELRTPNRVTLAAWNKVEIRRVDNLGSVRLNGHQEVGGSSQGDYTRITLRINLFVGGFSNMSTISPRVGTDHSFNGCIQELLINGHRYDFRQKGLVGEAEFGVNVGECSEGICDGVDCLNGGSCAVKSADEHVCLCPLGHHGDHCEKSSNVHVPHFSGQSYLEFTGLKRTVLSFTELELVVKPTGADGFILYNGLSHDRKGDFISLAMNEGHLEFRFDLGTGPAIIRSPEPIALNQWHLVRASRTGLMGILEIDGHKPVKGQSQGAYTQLTLLDGLYLGGHPNYDHTSRHANMSRSFTGCLQKVVINKKIINLLGDTVGGVNVGPCSHPCAGKPCLNDGQCKPKADSYTCYCPLGYSNTNCEDKQKQLPRTPMFDGDSYLMYTDKQIINRVKGNKMDLQILIKPRGPNGLVFWSGEDLSKPSGRDFTALAFHGGSLQLRYNLGSGEAVISYNNSQLFDGKWHFIKVQRNKQDAYMEIDDKEVVEGSSPGGYQSLNTDQVLYLGGMSNMAEVTGGRYTGGFVGCIKRVLLATDYQMKLLEEAHSGRNIVQCKKTIS